MTSSAPTPEIELELAKLPPAVLEAYQESAPPVIAAFGPDEVNLWAKEGISIGAQTIRSWEAAIEYYRVSPQVCRFLSFPSFMQWARCGTYLAPRLPHPRRRLLQIQRRHRPQPPPPIHPPLGRPRPQPLQRHLEIQHPRRQIL